MPYDESFAPEPAPAAPAPVADAPVADAPPVAAEPATEPVAPATPEPVAAEPAAEAPAEPAPTEPAAPAFNEAEFFQKALGDDAPKTAADLKTFVEGLKAKVITPEIEGQLAILRDPAKMAEFAAIAGKDYDKPTAAEIMRERFAQQHPGMDADLLDFRFQQQFANKYPTLAAALENPDGFAADDPALLLEKKAADYDALADRTALKTAQQEATQQFVAATAATGPQLTPAQQADAPLLLTWLDEAYKPGATIPVTVDGQEFKLPIADPAAHRAAFNQTYELLDKFALNPDSTINRDNQRLLTAFAQDPNGFLRDFAKQVRAGQPKPEPAIPVAAIANSSAARSAATPAPVLRTQSAVTHADEWLNHNV